MTYNEVLEFMFNSLPMYQRIGQAAYKADLENTIALDNHFLSPHKSYKTIHVAGTNGKGSVSHSIASVLQEAGYKTGLYTSPHLTDYRERIRVNGEKISKEFVTDFINKNHNLLQDIKPSFFEMSVALALEYFKDCKVDIAVIEVGMGGRLDSTNIINPILSIITNIGLDHTQFLGDSIEKIATEKAGIIKQNTAVIIGQTQEETKACFIAKAKSTSSMIYFADENFNAEIIQKSFSTARYKILSSSAEYIIDFELLGDYQKKNLPTIFQVYEFLNNNDVKISKQALIKGLSNIKEKTGLRGRWDILQFKPLIICDTGHNVDGIKEIVAQLKTFSKNKLHMIIGFVNDKNINDVLILLPKDAEYYFTQSSVPRAMPVNQIAMLATQYNLSGTSFNNVKDAYLSAIKKANIDDVIFVGGSNFVVGDLFEYLDAK
jgi:dihydrofolate synthase / folylpolyglutamate synthase